MLKVSATALLCLVAATAYADPRTLTDAEKAIISEKITKAVNPYGEFVQGQAKKPNQSSGFDNLNAGVLEHDRGSLRTMLSFEWLPWSGKDIYCGEAYTKTFYKDGFIHFIVDVKIGVSGNITKADNVFIVEDVAMSNPVSAARVRMARREIFDACQSGADRKDISNARTRTDLMEDVSR